MLGKFKRQNKEKKPKKVTATAAANDFINASREFEKSRISEIENSKKIAWRVAIGACAVAIASSTAVLGLTPLKEVQPYVIRVDNNTGQTDIVTTIKDSRSDYGEEVAKHFSANYVKLVESYDWYTIQTQVNEALLFSNADMQNQLNNKFRKPDAPHNVYRDKQRINIKIDNVSIIDKKGLLQVRFTKSIEPMDGGIYNPQDNTTSPAPVVSKHIATLGYEYVNVGTLDDVRIVNPLGFTVVTYRVDDEISAGNL